MYQGMPNLKSRCAYRGDIRLVQQSRWAEYNATTVERDPKTEAVMSERVMEWHSQKEQNKVREDFIQSDMYEALTEAETARKILARLKDAKVEYELSAAIVGSYEKYDAVAGAMYTRQATSQALLFESLIYHVPLEEGWGNTELPHYIEPLESVPAPKSIRSFDIVGGGTGRQAEGSVEAFQIEDL